jgi:hypothetical protein
MFTRKAVFVLAVALALLLVGCVPPPTLMRHVAEFRFGPEQFTTNTGAIGGTGGHLIYSKMFNLPANQNTIFVTLSTTGDTHDGAGSWFSALVNGAVCNPGDEGAASAPGGWIPLQLHGPSDDLHDNGIYYTWCCSQKVRPGGSNTVEIRMASSVQGSYVFVERSHYYIDSVQSKLCTVADPVPGAGGPAKARDEALPPRHRHPNQPEEQKPPPH